MSDPEKKKVIKLTIDYMNEVNSYFYGVIGEWIKTEDIIEQLKNNGCLDYYSRRGLPSGVYFYYDVRLYNLNVDYNYDDIEIVYDNFIEEISEYINEDGCGLTGRSGGQLQIDLNSKYLKVKCFNPKQFLDTLKENIEYHGADSFYVDYIDKHGLVETIEEYIYDAVDNCYDELLQSCILSDMTCNVLKKIGIIAKKYIKSLEID